MSGRVVVVGSLNVDLVFGLDRMPESGETVFGNRLEQHAGGKGLNQAVAAARLGATVELIGAVGSDASGSWLRDVVAHEGIGSTAILTLAGSSGTALIEVDAAGANRIVVVSGANGLVTGAQVEAAVNAADGPFVILTQGEVPADAVAAAMRMGRAAGATTILNPAPVRRYPDSVFACVDYVIPNEHEAELLTGVDTSSEGGAMIAARALVGLGAGCAIVTRGSEGSAWATEHDNGWCPAFTAKAIDTVAAGDAFCGALAAALAEGRQFDEALRWASAAGALATTVVGAVPSLPTREAVEALVSA